MWIYVAIAAALGFWYYEAHKSPAAPAASTGKPTKLDPNMPPALLQQLLNGVPLVTDPAQLDQLAAGLATAPAPGPYPIAAQWVAQQAAALRAKQKTGMAGPTGHTPVTIPSHNGPRPAVDFKHPSILAHLYLQALQTPKAPGPSASMSAPPAPQTPAFALNVKGKALMSLAWNALMKNGFEAAAWAVPPTYQYAWNPNTPPYYQPGSDEGIDPSVLALRNLYILGNLEEPSIMADPDAKTFWQSMAAGNPFFAKGTAASKALGWG